VIVSISNKLQAREGKSKHGHFRNQWTKMDGNGWINSDDHYSTTVGKNPFSRNRATFIVNKRVWNTVLGCNIRKKKKIDRMISVCFQGKPFNITVIKVSVQFRSVAQSCLTLCDPMNCSMPSLPIHHQLLEFTQTHIHWVSDAIQPSHPLSSPSPPAPNPSQHQSLFQWVKSSHEVANKIYATTNNAKEAEIEQSYENL